MATPTWSPRQPRLTPSPGGRTTARTTFTPITITETFPEAQPVHAVDIDSDGDLDVLGGAWLSDEISWWENDGQQNFSEHSVVTDYMGTYSVDAADLDGDGDVDILGAAYIADDVSWWENDGDEGFARHILTDTLHGATYVHTADLDSDGDVDVVASAYEDDTLVWWENQGEQSFVERIITRDFEGAYSVYAADVDGDGQYSAYSNVAQATTDPCPVPIVLIPVAMRDYGPPGPPCEKSTKTATEEAVNGSDWLRYNIDLKNTGDTTATFSLSDPIPSQSDYSAGSVWGCSHSDGLITWQGVLAPGANHHCAYSVRVDDLGPGHHRQPGHGQLPDGCDPGAQHPGDGHQRQL